MPRWKSFPRSKGLAQDIGGHGQGLTPPIQTLILGPAENRTLGHAFSCVWAAGTVGGALCHVCAHMSMCMACVSWRCLTSVSTPFLPYIGLQMPSVPVLLGPCRWKWEWGFLTPSLCYPSNREKAPKDEDEEVTLMSLQQALAGQAPAPRICTPHPVGPAWERPGAAVGTCAQEKHLIAPVSCIHLVHSNSGEAVGSTCADHQGPPLQRVHGLVHERVAAHEVDHLIRIVLGGLHRWCEGSTRALWTGGECQSQAAWAVQAGAISFRRGRCTVPTTSTCSSPQSPSPGFCPAPDLYRSCSGQSLTWSNATATSLASCAMTSWQHLAKQTTPFHIPSPPCHLLSLAVPRVSLVSLLHSWTTGPDVLVTHQAHSPPS